MKRLVIVLAVGLLALLPATALADSHTPNLDALDYWYLADAPAGERASIAGVSGGGDGGLIVTLSNGQERRLLTGERVTTLSEPQMDTRIATIATITRYDVALLCRDRVALDCTWYVSKNLTVEFLEETAGVSDEL